MNYWTKWPFCPPLLPRLHFTSLCHSQHFYLSHDTPAQIFWGECSPSGTDHSCVGAPQAEDLPATSSKATVLVSSPQWTSMCCRGTRASLWFSPVAAEEFLLQCMEHLLPLLLLLPWCLQHHSLSHFPHFSLSQLCSGFALSEKSFPICSTTLAKRLSSALWWVCWSRLEVVVSHMGHPYLLLSEGTPKAPLQTKLC